ncbi:MAG: hypothetical protein JO237_04345 [Pseudolabrys sp.]|nr:hypothetical protein [Pseudolabrys sp.]
MSAMPWYADTLMPDIFLPDAVLALYLLAFQSTRLRTWECTGLLAVVAFAMASHMATLALCVALVSALAMMRWMPLPRATMTWPVTAAAAGLLLAPLSNWAIAGYFTLTPGGETFLFGRLVQDGIVGRYVADRCPDPTLRLCEFKNEIPATADEWLWGPGNPLGKLGGWRGYQPEARRIIVETLQLYPGMHIKEAVSTSVQQLFMMRTEVSTVPDWIAPAIESLRRLTPQLMPRLKSGRQIATPKTVDRVLGVLNAVHVSIAAVSMASLLGAILFWRRLDLAPGPVALAAFMLLAIAGNIVICAVFSNPVDRYQSRLVWIAPLALFIVLAGSASVRSRLTRTVEKLHA